MSLLTKKMGKASTHAEETSRNVQRLKDNEYCTYNVLQYNETHKLGTRENGKTMRLKTWTGKAGKAQALPIYPTLLGINGARERFTLDRGIILGSSRQHLCIVMHYRTVSLSLQVFF